MAIKKQKKSSAAVDGDSKQTAADIDLLKSEVASFASTLGLSSTAPSSSSGFNDADFRKTGRLKQNQKPNAQPDGKAKPPQKPEKKSRNEKAVKPEIKPKPPVLTLDDDANPARARAATKYKDLPKLPLMKASATGVWHVDAEELEVKVLGEAHKKVDVKMRVEEWKQFVEKKRELGERLMWQYVQDYEQGRGQSGDIKMLVSTQRSGTAADKVSAFAVLIGDNPMANLRSVDALLGMVASKVGKRHALSGFEALRELFVESLLPDRKLKTLLQRPLNNLPETKDGYSLLLFWYWEDCLKQRYQRFVLALEEASKDMLPILKDKALKSMYLLLKSKSEQERRLLSSLVNKLGDPQSKGASNAEYYLSNLLSDHPSMKSVVIDEVDAFLFRPHLGMRAKYYAINFLSQVRLSNRDDGPKVAKRLIDVYFALFKVLITEAGGQKMNKDAKAEDKSSPAASKDEKAKASPESHIEMDSRILSTLLTGVNRAFPYVSSTEADDIVESQTPMLFQLVHSNNFNVGVQALMLLDKISSKNQIVSDRFYRSLYAKLLLPASMNSSKAKMFIGLILRAMKNDVNLKRVAAFAKRLLQVAMQQPPQYACGSLFLLSEVLKARPPLWNMVLQSEALDDEDEHFEDVVEDANDNGTPAITNEDLINIPTDERNENVDHESDSSSDEEDNAVASSSEDDESDEDAQLIREDRSEEVTTLTPEPSNEKTEHCSKKSSLPGGYDPRHREPSYCNADRASWWELKVLASHAHPSVATMAGTLLSGANIVYNGNPLNDLSLNAFLDKFMEKKAKQKEWHGGSQIEPAKKLDMDNNLIGPEIVSLAEEDVSPEDVVFHKFYTNKMNSTNPKKQKKKKKKTADEEDAEELFDAGDGGAEDDDDVGGVDESDNEEIDNLLDATLDDRDGEYDYDDLDRIDDEDEDELLGDVSDTEMGAFSDIGDESDIEVGDVDDGDDDDDDVADTKKRKRSKKKGASPFASFEDYEHLMEGEGEGDEEEDGPSPNKEKKKNKKKEKKLKPRKKKQKTKKSSSD
ncbi:Protein SLOW WALKER 2 [Linum grandiflorum]